jgi:hypothetical protein
MHDAQPVGVLQRLSGLDAPFRRPPEICRLTRYVLGRACPHGNRLSGGPIHSGGRRLVRHGWLVHADQLSQRLAIDELHGVVVDAAFLPHRVDRHDVLVMQTRRRQRLVLEPLQVVWVHRRRERQHFQCHPSIRLTRSASSFS